MDSPLDLALHSALEATEADYRKQIFSSGHSSLVSIWLISTFNKAALSDTDFLSDISPYIEKGYEVPDRLIQNIIDRPLYLHKKTQRHFFCVRT